MTRRARVDGNHAEIVVVGTPAPQGSKSIYRGRPVESSKAVKPWREAVKWAIFAQTGQVIPGAVAVDIEFRFARPKSAKKRLYPAVKPDLDKLERSTLDAMTQAGLIEDDSRVCKLSSSKVYVNGILRPGASITVRAMDEAKGAL